MTGYGWPLVSETEYEYGCVRCQAYHRESDGPVYAEHLMWQSKHGTRLVAARPRQAGQVPAGHQDANKPVGWGEHPRDCNCGDCP